MIQKSKLRLDMQTYARRDFSLVENVSKPFNLPDSIEYHEYTTPPAFNTQIVDNKEQIY